MSVSPSSPHQLDPNLRLPGATTLDLDWHSPLEEPFGVTGFAWFGVERRYRRLPRHQEHAVPPAVDRLANCTAGGQIRVRTDARTLAVRVRLAGAADMYHMTAAGQCGFDCYLGPPGQLRYHSTAHFDRRLTSYENILFDFGDRADRHVTLNFPLYQGVEEVVVGVDHGARLAPPVPYQDDRRVIFYGTSMTQGGCATRPGMAYTNILSRRIPVEFINLGFSGNGRGEVELARLTAEIERPGCLVVDYSGNTRTPREYADTLPIFVDTLRERHPRVPILVPSRPFRTVELYPGTERDERLERNHTAERFVRSRRAAGDQNLHYFDSVEHLGADFAECTVDGVHPTDLGFQRMADALEPVLVGLLR